MVFSSIPFLFFFLPLFLIVYYLVPFKRKGIMWKNIVLLIGSLIFYVSPHNLFKDIEARHRFNSFPNEFICWKII